MQSFIVLGIVPGTNFELTFNFWLYAVTLLLCTPFFLSLWRQRTTLYNYAVAAQLAYFIDRCQLRA